MAHIVQYAETCASARFKQMLQNTGRDDSDVVADGKNDAAKWVGQSSAFIGDYVWFVMLRYLEEMYCSPKVGYISYIAAYVSHFVQTLHQYTRESYAEGQDELVSLRKENEELKEQISTLMNALAEEKSKRVSELKPAAKLVESPPVKPTGEMSPGASSYAPQPDTAPAMRQSGSTPSGYAAPTGYGAGKTPVTVPSLTPPQTAAAQPNIRYALSVGAQMALSNALRAENRDQWEAAMRGISYQYMAFSKGDGSPYILDKGDARSLFIGIALPDGMMALVPSFNAANPQNPELKKLFDVSGTSTTRGYRVMHPALAKPIDGQYSVTNEKRGAIQA